MILDFETLNTLRGLEGEKIVKRILKNSGFKYIDDIYLKTERGTTQIDGVVVCESGIFVLEIKNIRGAIHGDIEKTTWVNKRDSIEYRSYSPILQNTGHIRNLRRELNYDGILNNLVLFPDDTEIEVNTDRVINYGSLTSYLKGGKVLDSEEIDYWYGYLTQIKTNNQFLMFKHM